MAASGPHLPDPRKKSHLIANPQCSCPKCDSVDCFTKRQDIKPCSCYKCENSKICLYYPLKDNTEDDLAKVKTSMKGDDILAKEKVKREITYEFNEVLKTRSVSQHKNKAILSGDKDGKVTIKEDNDSSAAKLSAQIMNVPYEKLHNDISKKESETPPYKLSAFDVLNKIRDAYKACSCKVCECLVGKSIVPRNKLCKCEPCDCKECMGFLSKFHYLGDPEKEPPDGCPCTRCTRSQCKGIANKFNEPQICDCPPCNCIKCDETYAKPCNCKPCQCLECKAMSSVPKAFIVAPVGEQYQRHNCNCSPCECLECGGHRIASSYMREAETNVHRHLHCQCETCANDACIADGTQVCKCQRRSRVMVKPLEKNIRDYDIRAIVTKDKVIRSNSKPLNSTIAMYATVPKYLHNNTTYRKECSCDVCECILCNCKETPFSSIKASRLFKDPHKIQFISNLDSDACNCAPCVCQICTSKEAHRIKSNATHKNCKCGICECLNCEGIIKDANDDFRSFVNVIKECATKGSCRCSPCECLKHTTSMICAGDVCRCTKHNQQSLQDSEESVYPIKRAEPLTSSLLSCEIKKGIISEKYNDRLFDHDIQSISRARLDRFNVTTHNNIVTSRGPTKNDFSRINMKTLLPSDKETHLLPTRTHVELKDKMYINENYTNICKYIAKSHSRAINRRCSEKNYTHSKTNLSVSSEFTESRNYKDYNKAAPATTESELRENSCDSGCGSYDYFSVFPESSKTDGQKIQAPNQFSQDMNAYLAENIVQKLDESQTKKTYDDNQSHHHNFNTDNTLNFPRANIIKNYSIKELRNLNSNKTSHTELHREQYWINNIDVSVTEHDQKLHDNIHNYSTENDYRHILTDNTNTIQDSDESLSHSQNIVDNTVYLQGKPVEDLFNNDTYYENIQKTLHRARAFSLELIKVLGKYERANNEFQSITQKLKLINASLFSDNILPEHESKEDDMLCLSPESNNLKTEHDDNIPLKNISTEQAKMDWFSSSSDFKYKRKKEQCAQNNNPSIFHFLNDIVQEEKPEHSDIFYDLNLAKRRRRNSNEFTMFSNRNRRGVKKSNKYSTGILKQIIIIPKEGQSSNVSNGVFKIARSSQTSQGKNYEEAASGIVPVSRSDLLTEEKKAAKKKNLEVLPISSKNFYLITPVTRNQEISKIPSLQGDIKAVRSISNQTKTSNNENEFVPRGKLALQNLQIEVQKLLRLPLLHNSHKILNNYSEYNTMWDPQSEIGVLPNLLRSTSCQTRHDMEYSSNANKAMDCKSPNGCCDALKVNFLGLRRVSDHTVLVKWTAPRITSDVTGYELLVDGRAVQKILSPSRCVAVVTRLPYCETVLLTIRTITPVTPSGHFPSSTVVYHPRVK